ncbi:MAG: leucine-rich repeat protein [Lachnospiraceae bacterium]
MEKDIMISTKDFFVMERGGVLSLRKYRGNAENVIIPDEIGRISPDAFAQCNDVKRITIPGSVKCISARAFIKMPHLEYVELGEGIETIEHEAFRDCISLKEVKLPNSLKKLEYAAFNGCRSLEKIEIGKKIKSLEPSILSHCDSLKEIIVPKTVQKLDNYAFDMLENLETIHFEGDIKKVNEFSFSNCPKLSEITFPKDFSLLDKLKFILCPELKQVKVGEDYFNIIEGCVTTIGNTKAVETKPEKNALIIDPAIPNRLSFDEDLQKYICEYKSLIFAWDEQKEDFNGIVQILSENYYSHLNSIIEFMLPDLIEMYGIISSEDVIAHLGRPVIDYDNGEVTYLEQSFDALHIFTFEFQDDEFENLQYFSIDG